MGAHTGRKHPPRPYHRPDGLFWTIRQSSRRVSDAAHGGQILLSRATWGLVKDELEDSKTKSFGDFQLKECAIKRN